MVVFLSLILSGWLLFTDLYIYSKLGLILFVVVTLVFLNGLGKKVPIKELIILIMLMQMVASPIIVYYYLDNKVPFPMDVDEHFYVSYVFFCIVLFIIGLFFPIVKQKNIGPLLVSKLKMSERYNGKFGIILIVIGMVSGALVDFFPGSLQFMVFLFENCKYIGAFYLFFSNNKFKYLWIIIVYGLLIYETIGGGLFINLFIWGFLFSIIITLKYNINLLLKTFLFLSGILVAFFIQSFKTEYREVIWDGKGQSYTTETMTKQEIFLEMAAAKSENTKDLYKYSNYSNFISRLNQGWILAKVLAYVPLKEPFTNGETVLSDIRASIVPRILDPGKTIAGGKEGAEKFLRFTGKHLIKGTRMTIGVLGDAYVNFGLVGGVVFMFCFGLFLNFLLGLIYRISAKYPSLILWIPFIFFYAMRAGNEFVVILNFITKSSIVVFVIFFLNKNKLKHSLNSKNTSVVSNIDS